MSPLIPQHHDRAQLLRSSPRRRAVALALAAGAAALAAVGAVSRVFAGGDAGGGPPAAAVNAALEGRPWRLVRYAGAGGQLLPVLPGTEITATFDAGRLSGSAGCNRYTTSYSLGGAASPGGSPIAIGPAASTRMFCTDPPGVMDQETAYLAALPTASIYLIEGDRLMLDTADRARVANFTAASGAASSTSDTASAAAGGTATSKITFDLASIDDSGLTGPPDGRVAVAYEFCVPASPAHLAEVRSIDPTVQAYPGSPGRIGCGPGQVLCTGSTHQPDWRSALLGLAALDYVTRIDRSFAE